MSALRCLSGPHQRGYTGSCEQFVFFRSRVDSHRSSVARRRPVHRVWTHPTTHRTTDESEHFPDDHHLRGARPPGRPRRRPRARGHHRALPDPGPHDPRRPRRPRPLRQGEDRVGQDPRLRPPARSSRIGKAQPGHPRGLVLVPTRELATQVTAALRALGAARERQRARGLRRRRDGAAGQGAAEGRRRRRRHAGPPHRPDGARRALGRRGRGPRRRRSRPHGRHGLHAPGAEDPLPHRPNRTRRCCSRPRSTAR